MEGKQCIPSIWPSFKENNFQMAMCIHEKLINKAAISRASLPPRGVLSTWLPLRRPLAMLSLRRILKTPAPISKTGGNENHTEELLISPTSWKGKEWEELRCLAQNKRGRETDSSMCKSELMWQGCSPVVTMMHLRLNRGISEYIAFALPESRK